MATTKTIKAPKGVSAEEHLARLMELARLAGDEELYLQLQADLARELSRKYRRPAKR